MSLFKAFFAHLTWVNPLSLSGKCFLGIIFPTVFFLFWHKPRWGKCFVLSTALPRLQPCQVAPSLSSCLYFLQFEHMSKSQKRWLPFFNYAWMVSKYKTSKVNPPQLLDWTFANIAKLYPVGLLAQLVRALHWYRRGQGFDSSTNLFFFFFQGFFSQLQKVASLCNCADLLYI